MELLNGSLRIEIFFEKNDQDYDDNICVCLKETGPEDEKILYANETNLYLTADEARKLAEMLNQAAGHSDQVTR